VDNALIPEDLALLFYYDYLAILREVTADAVLSNLSSSPAPHQWVGVIDDGITKQKRSTNITNLPRQV
jgi:hypothetical protein